MNRKRGDGTSMYLSSSWPEIMWLVAPCSCHPDVAVTLDCLPLPWKASQTISFFQLHPSRYFVTEIRKLLHMKHSPQFCIPRVLWTLLLFLISSTRSPKSWSFFPGSSKNPQLISTHPWAHNRQGNLSNIYQTTKKKKKNDFYFPKIKNSTPW